MAFHVDKKPDAPQPGFALDEFLIRMRRRTVGTAADNVRMCLLAVALLSCSGCATTPDKSSFTSEDPSAIIDLASEYVHAEARAWDPVRIDGGLVAGTVVDGVRSYLGIPYAAPPVGAFRWKPPQPTLAWNGVRACTTYGHSCPQPAYDTRKFWARAGNIPRSAMSEDCLYLNVWTDADEPSARRPVMVWFHGGGLITGSGAEPQVRGTSLAEKGVIVVTVNYRLNIFGYFAHPELTAESPNRSSGNYGLLDQIESLRWVQRNIEAFGGDPDRVTIFGELSGATSVQFLQTSPLAEGLFHRVIGQSGGHFDRMAYLRRDRPGWESQEKLGVRFAEHLVGQGASLADLRAKSTDEIIEAFSETVDRLRWLSFANVDGWVLTEDVLTVFERGGQHDVPVLLGCNADEWTSLAFGLPQTDAACAKLIEERYGELTDEFLALYRPSERVSMRDALLAGRRERITWKMRQWARHTHPLDSEAYLYFFTRAPDLHGDWELGAYHTAEIGYVFDNLHTFTMRTVHREDNALSDVISQYWVNFATHGDPNGTGLPLWKPHNEEAEYYMELGDSVICRKNLLEAECDFFEKFRGEHEQGR